MSPVTPYNAQDEASLDNADSTEVGPPSSERGTFQHLDATDVVGNQSDPARGDEKMLITFILTDGREVMILKRGEKIESVMLNLQRELSDRGQMAEAVTKELMQLSQAITLTACDRHPRDTTTPSDGNDAVTREEHNLPDQGRDLMSQLQSLIDETAVNMNLQLPAPPGTTDSVNPKKTQSPPRQTQTVSIDIPQNQLPKAKPDDTRTLNSHFPTPKALVPEHPSSPGLLTIPNKHFLYTPASHTSHTSDETPTPLAGTYPESRSRTPARASRIPTPIKSYFDLGTPPTPPTPTEPPTIPRVSSPPAAPRSNATSATAGRGEPVSPATDTLTIPTPSEVHAAPTEARLSERSTATPRTPRQRSIVDIRRAALERAFAGGKGDGGGEGKGKGRERGGKA